MRKILLLVIIALIFIGGLFVHQNLTRLPEQDTQGGYLSLDLGFVGFQINEPAPNLCHGPKLNLQSDLFERLRYNSGAM